MMYFEASASVNSAPEEAGDDADDAVSGVGGDSTLRLRAGPRARDHGPQHAGQSDQAEDAIA